jgi:hypothetical protein
MPAIASPLKSPVTDLRTCLSSACSSSRQRRAERFRRLFDEVTDADAMAVKA